MKSAKILVMNGSPNPNGLGYRLAKAAVEFLKENEQEVLEYNQYEKDFESCKGCLTCFSNGQCLLGDKEAFDFEELMMNSDGILLLCPTYMHQMPGSFKTSFDRFSYRMHEFPLLGKKLIVITYAISNGTKELGTFITNIFRSIGTQLISNRNYETIRVKEEEMIKEIKEDLLVMCQQIESNQFAVTRNQEHLFQYIKSIVKAEMDQGFESHKHKRWQQMISYDSLVDYLQDSIV